MHNRFRNKHFPFSPSSTFLQRHIPDIQSVLLLSQPEIPPLDNTTAGALKKKGRGGGGVESNPSRRHIDKPKNWSTVLAKPRFEISPSLSRAHKTKHVALGKLIKREIEPVVRFGNNTENGRVTIEPSLEQRNSFHPICIGCKISRVEQNATRRNTRQWIE